MILPSKLFTYRESAVSKMPLILDCIKNEPMQALDLYKHIARNVNGVSEFMDVLDCLYALRRIEYDSEKGVLRYVKGD